MPFAQDNGVEGLIGRADPNTKSAIRAEHCLSEDSHDEFEASNTSIKTTSWREYWLVVGREDSEPLGEEEMPTVENEGTPSRTMKAIKQLLDEPVARDAKLTWEEIVCLRLYSGPMYMKYNTILRNFPQESVDTLKGNKYTTTIHLILSGILKLSRVQPIPTSRMVYRGLGGRRLPKEFYITDKNGSRGGVEAAFMSTSTDVQVALEYAGKGHGGKRIIFEIELGKMSMGADIQFLSQYPNEKEILFTPLTHLEIIGQPSHKVLFPPYLPPLEVQKWQSNSEEMAPFDYFVPFRFCCHSIAPVHVPAVLRLLCCCVLAPQCIAIDFSVPL